MKKPFILFILLTLTGIINATNISVSNLTLSARNTTDHYCAVQFNIAWDSSWRTSSAPNNWDAAWVFVKYRVGSGTWQHAWLNNTGHTAPAGSSVDIGLLDHGTAFNAATNPGIGAFIYRSADGKGAFSKIGIQLRWNYGANGVADGDIVQIQAFAIEMVYVPKGAFALGSGGSETSAFYNYPTSTNTYPISTEAAITVGTTTDNLYYASSTYGGDRSGPIPAAFPKGYNSFYCMKYEISQQGYVDFLNALTYTQQAGRTAIVPNSTEGTYINGSGNNRNKIKISTSGVASSTPAKYVTDYPYVACNFLNWTDVAAYLDWSGLRPMTELEFEKACRGTGTPVANEYAWGTSTTSIATGISNGGDVNETADASGTNVFYNSDGTLGPLRVGAFARTSTTREQAGASFYGIMEMSGNVWERPVTVGNPQGRSFTGTCGDGGLNSSGDANASNWPESDGTGVGLRGGDWYNGSGSWPLSTRYNASYSFNDRYSNCGGRGVRGVFSPVIGQTYGGGIIFYIDGTGSHGLIASATDQSTGAIWGCYGTAIGTSTTIGSGQSNTTAIVNGCSTSGIPARICNDLVLNGYEDWFFPSKDELNLMQINLQRNGLGGFATNLYFSSSEYEGYETGIVWGQYFGGGVQDYLGKYATGYVRAVRAF